MDPAVKALKAALEAIRDTTLNALAQIAGRKRNIPSAGYASGAGVQSILQGLFHWKSWQMPEVQKHRV